MSEIPLRFGFFLYDDDGPVAREQKAGFDGTARIDGDGFGATNELDSHELNFS